MYWWHEKRTLIKQIFQKLYKLVIIVVWHLSAFFVVESLFLSHLTYIFRELHFFETRSISISCWLAWVGLGGNAGVYGGGAIWKGRRAPRQWLYLWSSLPTRLPETSPSPPPPPKERNKSQPEPAKKRIFTREDQPVLSPGVSCFSYVFNNVTMNHEWPEK